MSREEVCPSIKVNSEIREMDQCTKHRACPKQMKCCRFNCAKKCLDLKQDTCSLPQTAGPCLAYIPCWCYDKCSRFIYGDCQGNNNNFQSESVCQVICRKKKSE